MPPCATVRLLKLKPLSTNEVDDFLNRNWAHIEKETRPIPFKHTCPYPPGSTSWHMTWRFPFVRRHVYKTVCCCDIIHIMDEITVAVKREHHEQWGLVDVYND